MSDLRETFAWNWAVTEHGRVLHGVEQLNSVGDHEESPDTWAYGDTFCGYSGKLYVPGLLTRMGARRCKKCSRILGWPDGHGSPKNDDSVREMAQDQWDATEIALKLLEHATEEQILKISAALAAGGDVRCSFPGDGTLVVEVV